MDSLDVIKVCLRRWYIFLPLILLAAGAGVGLGKQVKPTYSATGSYSFIYPNPDAITATSDPRNRNPLVTQGNTSLLGEAVQANLTSELVEDALGGNNRGYAPDETPTAGSLHRDEASAVGLLRRPDLGRHAAGGGGRGESRSPGGPEGRHRRPDQCRGTRWPRTSRRS